MAVRRPTDPDIELLLTATGAIDAQKPGTESKRDQAEADENEHKSIRNSARTQEEEDDDLDWD